MLSPLILSVILGCETAPKASPNINPTSPETISTDQPVTQEAFPTAIEWDPNEVKAPSFMTDKLKEALFTSDWKNATTLITDGSPEAKILSTWLAIQSGQTKSVRHNIDIVSTTNDIPDAYRAFMLGALHLSEDKLSTARRQFALIPPESTLKIQAQWLETDYLLSQDDLAKEELENTVTALQSLAALEHPFPKGDAVLSALIERTTESDKLYPLYRELWASYPYSTHTKKIVGKLKALETTDTKYKATADDWRKRSTQQMGAWQWKTLIAELKPIIPTLTMNSEASCAVRYAYGRSHFKINSVTKASQILPKVGDECKGHNNDVGAKAWYLIGKSYERKKMWKEAAKAYQKIPEMYPEHSMADDGYALAGIGYQEVGDMDTALSLWEKQVKTFPEGDLVGEGYWRLAWTTFLAGNTNTAIAWAQEAQTVVPESGHPYQYFAFPYWEARWKVYPSHTEHGVENIDIAQVTEGIEQWKQLVSNHPSEFYALLAAGHLWELDSDWMKADTSIQWTKPTPQKTWTVSTALGEAKELQVASQLNRLGLFDDAQTTFAPIKNNSTTHFAIYARLAGEENWSTGHDLLHKYIQKHPPHTWTDNQAGLWYQAYPNQYWDLLQAHATNHPDDYPYDIRIFHSLVREESSFNKDIVSWAGAKGLSQLMPATAQRVAAWVGVSVNSTTIFDPSTNLRIGSKYLGYLHGYFNGNPFLAVAAYNAGEGNVGKWLKSKGNLPTDMFIESIPFRETRHYVKRVLGTYQAYHLLYDQSEDTPIFIDLHDFNHVAKP